MATKTVKPQPQRKDVADPVSLQISLYQLLNLALNTPEVGTVNLNILHNFLHVLLHLISLESAKVEYRGEHASRIKSMLDSSGKGPSLELHEYNITGGTGKDATKEGPTEKHIVPSDTGELEQRITEVENTVTHMEQVISDLQATLSQPQEIQVQSATVTKTKGNPKSVKSNKPADAKNHVSESKKHSVGKSPPVEDDSSVIDKGSAGKTAPAENEHSLTDEESGPESITAGKNNTVTDKDTVTRKNPNDKPTTDKTPTDKAEVGKPTENERYVTDEESGPESITAGRNETVTDKGTVTKEKPADKPTIDKTPTGKPTAVKPGRHPNITAEGVDVVSMQEDIAALKIETTQLRRDVQNVNNQLGELLTGKREKAYTESRVELTQMPGLKETIEIAMIDTNGPILKQYWEVVQYIERTHADLLNELNDRISELEKEVSTSTTPTAGIAEDSNLNELVAKIQGIQADVEKFNKIADRLISDREGRETHINTLIQQIEFLKCVKANKEDLEDALADKADAQIVNRKVSHDRFDTACEELARALEDTITRLCEQQYDWQQSLNEVQKEVEGKVDKIEMIPLKDFVSERLKTLQEKLKKLTEMNKEKDAAGSKKILRDVQCISCDKDVVMKTEEVGRYRAEPLPCTVSMKPYLTYELDQVRKQQRRIPHSRNMLIFEAALRENGRKMKSIKDGTIVKTPRDHLCNRYCGGSHTITTPQQRIMRMGHFLSQWGAEVVPLTDGVVHRSDTQMYKSGKLVDICGPCCEVDDSAPTEPVKPFTAPQAAPAKRKSQQSKRSSVTSRRRSTRKSSGESAAERIADVPVSTVEGAAVETKIMEEVLPVDPTAHDDRIIRGNDELYEDEMEYEAYNK